MRGGRGGTGGAGQSLGVREILRGAAEPRPSLDAVIDEIALFAADAALAIGESRAVGYLRKFYPWYLAGYDIPQPELAQLLTAPSSERRARAVAFPGGRLRGRLITTGSTATFRRRHGAGVLRLTRRRPTRWTAK